MTRNEPVADAGIDGHEPRGLDGLVERLARRRAGRSTRRSFLGRAGRAAVLVAAGPTLATLLDADVAEARVCGQSGVSPPCDTYDCNATWGWCWYASGCCAGGLLKKICDCCAPNTPNPRGYCPSGTRVLCVVESCGADPRLQVKSVSPTAATDPVLLAVDASRVRYPSSPVPIAVVGDAESTGFAASAASLGGVMSGPVLLTRRGQLAAEVRTELQRLGTEFVKVVGSQLTDRVDADLTDLGVAVERVGTAPDLAAFSGEVAAYSRSYTGSRRALVVFPGVAPGVLAAAGSVANLHRLPLLLDATSEVRPGLTTPRATRTTYVVATDATEASRFPGGIAISGDNGGYQAGGLAELLLDLGGAPTEPLLTPYDDMVSAPGLAVSGRPVLLHSGEQLYDGTRNWLLAHRDDLDGIEHVGSIPDSMRYELQSTVNEFEAHLLRGVSGDGLPVIPQPLDERPIGEARDTRPAAEQVR